MTAPARPWQADLFSTNADAPEGFRYKEDFLTPNEEASLIEEIGRLPFKPFEFRGFQGRRRVVSYGARYDYSARMLQGAAPIPEFLNGLRARAAGFAGLAEGKLGQALVTEYAPGAPIGWHRDKKEFDDVIGISLLSPCRLRFRRLKGDHRERLSVGIMPRSVYLLRGPAREEWEHSIPPLETLRYSITFRSLADG